MPTEAPDTAPAPFASLWGLVRVPLAALGVAFAVTALAWAASPEAAFAVGLPALLVAVIASLVHMHRQERRMRLATELGMAAYAGNDAKAEALLAAGAEPDALPQVNPLFSAAAGDHPAIVRRLLAHGADPNRSEAGITPLFGAALRGHAEIAGMLLDREADPNARSRPQGIDLFTDAAPLHGAACGGHKETVALLLERGADPAARTAGGATPLDVARSNNQTESIALLEAATQG